MFPYLAVVFKVKAGNRARARTGSDEEIEIAVWDLIDYFSVCPKRNIVIK